MEGFFFFLSMGPTAHGWCTVTWNITVGPHVDHAPFILNLILLSPLGNVKSAENYTTLNPRRFILFKFVLFHFFTFGNWLNFKTFLSYLLHLQQIRENHEFINSMRRSFFFKTSNKFPGLQIRCEIHLITKHSLDKILIFFYFFFIYLLN